MWRAPLHQQPGIPRLVNLWDPAFVAPAPLFRVPGISWSLATDALADRVMRAGISDVVFMDIENDGTRTAGIIYRELG